MAPLHTDGMIFIRRVANGYLVTLPVRESNFGDDLSQAAAGMAQKIIEARDEDLPISGLERVADEQEQESEYELVKATNAFVFKSMNEVLQFLTREFSGL